MKLAERMERLGTETAFEVLARAQALEAQGKDIIHLEIGEPDFDTPPNVIEAGVLALRSGFTHYTPAAGLPALREAIAEDQSARKGISATPDQVVVVPGGKPIMFYLMLALIEQGDEVVYPNPGFPIYQSMIDFSGGTGIPIGYREDRGIIRWDIDSLLERVNKKTKLIIVNSPSNPVGSTVSDADLERIAGAAVEHDAFVLSDEIYSRMLYDGNFRSIASFDGMIGRTCILDGFSKTYAMTGWRLGFGVMPVPLAVQIARLATNCNSCVAASTQIAGIEALRGPQARVDEMVEEFRRRRRLMVEGLNSIPGVECSMPQGAFYVFPNIVGTGMESREMADYLLYQANVACLSGTAFGANGEGYIRLSYANSYDNLQRALVRLNAAISAKTGARVG